ncbi:hypothetical protein CspHIS471_0700890 [Cutaneotrichosporon sp. HIS471]|nr:hypothetical protein CspHIS471_0700890 [Cutaneotrichosporon sp. HIS471]
MFPSNGPFRNPPPSQTPPSHDRQPGPSLPLPTPAMGNLHPTTGSAARGGLTENPGTSQSVPVPDEPSSQETIATATITPTPTPTPKTPKRGRPRKNAEAGSSSTTQKTLLPDTTLKRKRGRPAKKAGVGPSVPNPAQNSLPSTKPNTPQKTPRKRGRPSKNAEAGSSSIANLVQNSLPSTEPNAPQNSLPSTEPNAPQKTPSKRGRQSSTSVSNSTAIPISPTSSKKPIESLPATPAKQSQIPGNPSQPQSQPVRQGEPIDLEPSSMASSSSHWMHQPAAPFSAPAQGQFEFAAPSNLPGPHPGTHQLHPPPQPPVNQVTNDGQQGVQASIAQPAPWVSVPAPPMYAARPPYSRLPREHVGWPERPYPTLDEPTLIKWMLNWNPPDQILMVEDFTFPTWKTDRMLSALVGGLLRSSPPQLVLVGSRRYEHLKGTVGVTPDHIHGMQLTLCRVEDEAVLTLNVVGMVFQRYAPDADLGLNEWRWHPMSTVLPQPNGELRIRASRQRIHWLRDSITSMLTPVLNQRMLDRAAESDAGPSRIEPIAQETSGTNQPGAFGSPQSGPTEPGPSFQPMLQAQPEAAPSRRPTVAQSAVAGTSSQPVGAGSQPAGPVSAPVHATQAPALMRHEQMIEYALGTFQPAPHVPVPAQSSSSAVQTRVPSPGSTWLTTNNLPTWFNTPSAIEQSMMMASVTPTAAPPVMAAATATAARTVPSSHNRALEFNPAQAAAVAKALAAQLPATGTQSDLWAAASVAAFQPTWFPAGNPQQLSAAGPPHLAPLLSAQPLVTGRPGPSAATTTAVGAGSSQAISLPALGFDHGTLGEGFGFPNDVQLLVAAYAPGTTAIVLRAAGGSPRFPGLRDAIEATQDVSFAYALVRDKGLVLLVLGGVGGVKRAKAIVHARAFAALFPDYLALATLTTAAELTDKLIAERLGMSIDDVVERGGDATPSASVFVTAPSTQPASALSSAPSSPAPPLPSKSPGPPVPPTRSIPTSFPTETSSSGSTSGPSSSSGLTPRGNAFARSAERDLPDLPDDPTTPRAAVQMATTSSSVVAPVPQRLRKRSASPPPSSGIEKTTPAPHSHSQPTSPSIPSPESLPSMMSHTPLAQAASAIPITPTTPITPVTPKAPVNPNAPQQLYQGVKDARMKPSPIETAPKDAPTYPEPPSRGTAFPAAGSLVAAAATVLGVRTATSVQTSSPLISSPNASFRSRLSSSHSNFSDSPRQRSVSNSSGRLGSEASSTRPLSRDSGYWGGRPPSRDASVPTSVTSDSRRSSRRGSDPSFSPSMLSRMSMGDAPPVPPLPHELRHASREPMRGEPEPLRVASVPHSPASSPLIHSPHSRRGSSGSRHSHFMSAPLPVPDHPLPAVPTIPNPLPNPAGMPLAPSSAVGSPPVGFGSPPIPQRSRQRLVSGHGGRPLPPPSPVPDGPLPPVPNVPPLSSKTPLRPPRRGLNASAGPSPDPSSGGFNQAPLPPVPAAVREASLAIADSGQNSLLSSPLVSSPHTSPRLSAEPLSPMSPRSRVGSGSGAFFSARSSMVARPDSERDSSRFDSLRSSMRYDSGPETSRGERGDSSRRDSGRPISTMLPYAQSESREASPRQSQEQGVATSSAGWGLGLGITSVDLSTPARERSLDRVGDSGARPLSTSSFASIKSNRAPPPPPVTIPVAARTPGVTGAPDSAPSSAASSTRSAGKKYGPKKSNSISRKPVPAVDAVLLSSPDQLLAHTPARKSSLRRVVEASVSPQLSSSPSVGGPTELLAAPEALMVPPLRDSPRSSTPRLPPSPAFGTPPTATASLDIDGGMPQSISPSPQPRSVRSASGSSTSSPLVRAASVRGSPRLGSPAQLERSRSLKGRELRPEILPGEGRTVRGIDLSAVGSDVVGLAPAIVAPTAIAPAWRPQTPQTQTRAALEDAASPYSILSSPQSVDAMEMNEAPSFASAQVVTAKPALARVLSLSNGQVTNINPDSARSDKTRPLSSPVSPSRRIPSHAKSASESETPTPSKSPALRSTSETHTQPRGIGLGFVPAYEDEVERITVEDDEIDTPSKASSRAPSTASPGSRNVVDLGSEGSTPVQSVTATMPVHRSPPTPQRDLPPIPPTPKSQLAPPATIPTASATPTPHVVRRTTSSKFRLPFRSPHPAADDDDLSPPMSPTSARLRTHSITNAFRRRRNTNSGTPPGSPPVRNSLVSSNSTSEDHSTLPYEYGLQGLGLSSFALAPSAYRTPGGGIGYTPPKMERKLSLTAQEAFASARERQALEQAAQLEAFRKSEKARSLSHTSSANPTSRVTSLAMSSEFMSDESHYDDASDEVPQSLSLAMVTVAGTEPVASPVEQLAAAASAARLNRHGARYSPSSTAVGDNGLGERQRPNEESLAEPRRGSLRGDDEFHDAVSQMDDDFTDSDSELELNGFNHDLDAAAAEREEAERAHREAAERAELAEREEREAAERAEAERLEHEAAEREAAEHARREEAEFEAADLARREAEDLRLQEEREAEELRLLKEREAAFVAETRRLEKERLHKEAARIEEDRIAAKNEEERLASLLHAEAEERRAASDAQRRVREEHEAEEARLAQERRLVEMEERLAAQQEEARLAAEREAEREAAERAEEERLEAERAEQERATIAAAKAEQERFERSARERDEVTRQLQGGKSEGGVMLRGWVTVQTMNSPTWRRRYFHLLASELRLFKSDSESDTGRALTTVPLGNAKISEAYEESAVQGSWKVEAGNKEFYMFADSVDDRATVLQGLVIAIG